MIIINPKGERWNQWLAGLTDGDGCFYLSKKDKNVSFEITTHTTDARVLYNIKNTLKVGTVKLRSNSQSVRFRVKQKAAILDIVNRLNGKLYNKARVAQLKSVCLLYNIQEILAPPLVDKKSAYLTGLIDSDGSLAISVSRSSTADSQISGVQGRTTRLINSRGFNQISLKITSIDLDNLILIQNSYGVGAIYREKGGKSSLSQEPLRDKHHWTIRSYEDFQLVYEFLKLNPLKSVKMHRMRLALLYFRYKDLGYHLKKLGTIEAKVWAKFCVSWFKYNY